MKNIKLSSNFLLSCTGGAGFSVLSRSLSEYSHTLNFGNFTPGVSRMAGSPEKCSFEYMTERSIDRKVRWVK